LEFKKVYILISETTEIVLKQTLLEYSIYGRLCFLEIKPQKEKVLTWLNEKMLQYIPFHYKSDWNQTLYKFPLECKPIIYIWIRDIFYLYRKEP
jgi:hypothetical protein